MRLFSIIQWHHFAYMMISVALLGYGAAGSVRDAGPASVAGALHRRHSHRRRPVRV
ncbi:MAG: hypothetical protein MZV65_48755 [Chromatiales bacterium]|nr:hypothetical protein [Chromatiales bacterium]